MASPPGDSSAPKHYLGPMLPQDQALPYARGARPIDKLLSPVRLFLEHRLAGAAVLVGATLLALVLANSKLHGAYEALIHTEIAFTLGDFRLAYPLSHWVSDGLMSVFFFMVGLEIKRELMVGELSTLRKASLPAVAALGGMIGPALTYAALNQGLPSEGGWGIPTATDIAFALGILALLGDRVPVGAKVFLTALAIVDDIGAVVVIAFFYTTHMNLPALGLGMGAIAVAILLNKLGVRRAAAYLAVGLVAWLLFLKSGVHATIAALLMAFTIPARTRIHGHELLDGVRGWAHRLEAVGVPETTEMNTPEQQQAINGMAQCIDEGMAPLQSIEEELHTPVVFIILPLFALVSAGVSLETASFHDLTTPIGMGIIAGLFVGKQAGITLATWLAVRLKLCDLPAGVTWRMVHAMGVLGGIGFTMSLFITGLAFSDPASSAIAKMGILTGSLVSAVVGYLLLSVRSKKSERNRSGFRVFPAMSNRS
jgi:Na+:H+ antiporter, NhaA family